MAYVRKIKNGYQLKYYLDGILIGELPYEFKATKPARGDLIIGNSIFPWTSPFRNKIGEIYILKQAMSSDDIREMYLAGRVR